MRYLFLEGAPVKSLAALEDCPLETLVLNNCASLTQLPTFKNARFRSLSFFQTPICSLSGIQGLPSSTLEELRITTAPLTDLKPLAGARKLETITLFQVPVRDLTPLKETGLIDFTISRPLTAADKKVLQSIPTLKRVNNDVFIP